MTSEPLDIAIVGLSITSSWGNGHATTFRALVRELSNRGHRVTFYERDVPWYRENRDLPNPDFCRVVLYESVDELTDMHGAALRVADLVIVGSYVPEGIAVIDRLGELVAGIFAFYDIDTPVTLGALFDGSCEYVTGSQVPRFDLYLSFTGGPVLRQLERELGVPAARPLYCSFDPDLYEPVEVEQQWELGYLGTWSADRQPGVERLLCDAARALPERRFAVAGPQYPADIAWPSNVERTEHIPPAAHARFYSRQRFTLNVTRAAMVRLGYSPSVRLFEAAACGVPVISDRWEGIEQFFHPGSEILLCDDTTDVLRVLRELSDDQRASIGRQARQRVLSGHTAAHRAQELESHVREAAERRSRNRISSVRTLTPMLDRAQS